MKKTLIGSSLLAVFLLLMLPTVAAEGMKIAQSGTQNPLIDEAYVETLLQNYQDHPSPQIILITLAILLLKLLRWGIIIIGGVFLLVILSIIRKPNNNTSAVL
jgi:hypothetical protein